MFSQINSDIKDKIKGLSFEYKDVPQPQLLIVVPNPNPEIEYTEHLEYHEFTSLCPLAPTQPDFATIYIDIVPDKFIIELKSMKFYLTSYRNVSIFHEAVIANILKDIFSICLPKQITITGEFTVRGGIKTTISAIKP